jgi:hypothetical protein
LGLAGLPSIVAGFDVETSDWEPAYGFKQMDTHFQARLPCRKNHQGQPGYVCEVGFAVFRLIVGTRAYMSEDPVSKQIRMHHGANNSAKPFAVHGISDESVGRRGGWVKGGGIAGSVRSRGGGGSGWEWVKWGREGRDIYVRIKKQFLSWPW